jgi:3-hydroxyisobutyrate dehydrogenase
VVNANEQPAAAVAVLGAGGTMGRPIAVNLAAAGMAVRAWNRSAERAEPLAEHGIEIAATPAEAVAGARLIITMLSDAGAVRETVEGEDGALAAAAGGATWAQMSTIGIEPTEECAELAAQRGLVFVDAPVLGTKAPAEQGELIVLASGPDGARPAVEPAFEAIGKRTIWAGEAGAGTRLKLVVNSWLLSVVEGAAETIALAEGIGVDPEDFFDAIAGGPLDLPYMQMKARAMIARDFEPSFRLALAAKDADLVLDAAQRHHLDLPMLTTIALRMQEGVHEHGDEDVSATFRTSAGPAA